MEKIVIYFGKAGCLVNLRFVAAAFLLLAMSLGLPPGAAAQGWDLEIVVVDGNTTYFRCNSVVDFTAQTNDCSGNLVGWDCNGEVIAVERDNLGGCVARIATATETITLTSQQEAIVDIILTGLDFQEAPGGGPQDALEGLLNSNDFLSAEFIQTQVFDGTSGVTTAPIVSP